MRWRDVRAPVGVEDARVVDHLVADGHHARRLHDAVAVAVDDAQHRADDAARDAAVVEREVLRGLERPVAERALVARGAALLGLGGERGRAAVGRIDDDRRLAEGATGEIAAEGADRVLGVLDAVFDLLLPRRELLVGLIERVAERLRTGGRNAARVVARPHALQIGVAPRRPRHRVGDRRAAVVGRDHQCRAPRPDPSRTSWPRPRTSPRRPPPPPVVSCPLPSVNAVSPLYERRPSSLPTASKP